jgi:hypothetical protein
MGTARASSFPQSSAIALLRFASEDRLRETNQPNGERLRGQH